MTQGYYTMSKIFKNLKKLFIIEEEETVSSEEQNQDFQASSNEESAAIKQTNHYTGEVNQKFLDILLLALEQQNREGLDYLEFKQSLKSLDKMPMDESVKFHSAFAMAYSMGATSEKLIDSAEFYIGVLNGEKQKFKDTLSRQIIEQVDNKEQEIAKDNTDILSKRETIKKLEEEIKIIQTRIEETTLKKEASRQRINSASQNFDDAFKIIVDTIQDDIQKISQFLKK
jgi:hypothetical protein